MEQLINTDSEYEAALKTLEALKLTNPAKDTEEADEIDLLAYLIASYERHTADWLITKKNEAIRGEPDDLDTIAKYDLVN